MTHKHLQEIDPSTLSPEELRERLGAAIVAKYDLNLDLLRALEDAHEDDDSGVALNELLDIAEAATAAPPPACNELDGA